MSVFDGGAEAAFAEAHAQSRASVAGQWSSRAVFWAAQWFGASALAAAAMPDDRWRALWEVAWRQHLPPIPGAVHVGASPSVAVAEQGLAHMRAIVGERAKHVHR